MDFRFSVPHPWDIKWALLLFHAYEVPVIPEIDCTVERVGYPITIVAAP